MDVRSRQPLLDRYHIHRCIDFQTVRTLVALFLILALISIMITCYLLIQSSSSHDLLVSKLPERLPALSLLTALTRSDRSAQLCVDTPKFVFAREYFRSPSRKSEIIRALTETIQLNICSSFVIVISDPDYIHDLNRLQSDHDIDLIVYWSPAQVTYDLLLLAIKLSNPSSIFVLSTADVRIPSLAPLRRICARGFDHDPSNVLFTISRRDSDQTSCQQYKNWASWDVFIGNAALIDDYVLENTRFAPTFWGVENVLVYVLLHGLRAPYNLCPYVDVVHYHEQRDDKTKRRVRISHADNSVIWQQLSLDPVCEMESLQRQYPGYQAPVKDQ